MWLALSSLCLVAATFGADPHPQPYTKINASQVPAMAKNELKIHYPALNSMQYGILMPSGKMKAFQYFMKRKEKDFLNVDIERYLEILSYVHELVEWGTANPPPGGYSIYNSSKPNNNLPMYHGGVGRKKRSAESEEESASWPEKIHKMVKRVHKGDQTLEKMVKDLAGLYETEVRSSGLPLSRVVRELKRFLELERVKRDVLELEDQGDLVTIFDTEAEKKYIQFFENTRKKKEAHAAEENSHRSKKGTRPYVEAVGNYIFVPKNTDVNVLQEEYRKAINEQRLARGVSPPL